MKETNRSGNYNTNYSPDDPVFGRDALACLVREERIRSIKATLDDPDGEPVIEPDDPMWGLQRLKPSRPFVPKNERPRRYGRPKDHYDYATKNRPGPSASVAWMTTTEAVSFLRVTDKTLRSLIDRGVISAKKYIFKGQYVRRLLRADVIKFRDSRRRS